MVGTIGYHHDVHSVEFNIDLGYPDSVDEQGRFTAQVLDGVTGESLEMVDDSGLRIDHLIGDVGFQQFAAERDPALTDVEPAIVDPDLHTVAHLGEDFGTHVVEQGDSRRDQDLRPQVRPEIDGAALTTAST